MGLLVRVSRGESYCARIRVSMANGLGPGSEGERRLTRASAIWDARVPSFCSRCRGAWIGPGIAGSFSTNNHPRLHTALHCVAPHTAPGAYRNRSGHWTLRLTGR